MAVDISIQYYGGFLPDIYTADPRLLPSGNPFNTMWRPCIYSL